MAGSVTRRLAGSPAAPVLSWVQRVRYLAMLERQRLSTSVRWLFGTREHSNYTADLTPRSVAYLSAYVSVLSGRSIHDCADYIEEVLGDSELAAHIEDATLRSSRRGISDTTARIGRRAGWYALVRALRPQHIVETGTDKGLGSVVLAAALLRNGSGRLTTIDINEESGFLISGPYAAVTDRRIGSSIDVLSTLAGIDMFIHDSNHDPDFETQELIAVESRLTPGSMVLTDNSQSSTALFEWSLDRGRAFLDFRDEPAIEVIKADGIGASWDPATRQL